MDGVKSVEEMSLSEPSIVVGQVVAAGGKVETELSPKPSDFVKAKKRIIDTAQPFQSVKEAVSKFGGTIDWKANRALSMERIILPKEDSESTRKLIDELKLSLEKAQKEERQAKQDSEFMRLKVQEMEQHIEEEASIAVKAELEVDKAMHAAAVSDLKAVQEELETLRNDYAPMVIASEKAIKEAEEAVAESKKIEKIVEDLTSELIATKESLESGQTKNLKLERERTRAATVGDLKSQLDLSSLLLDLKAKLEETKLKQQQYYEEQRKELEEAKCKIAKATAEVNYLRVASLSLKSELEEEKSVNAMISQREEMASNAVASFKDELDRIHSEVALVQQKEKEAREKMIELPKKLEEAAQEADEAKMLAQEAHFRLDKAEEEAEQAKAKTNEMESRLLATQKELEAIKASEKSAMASAKALQENESARRRNSNAESPPEVTLSVKQYHQLCKLAHEANEQANRRISAANSHIDMAKESELKSLTRLEELNRLLSERRKLLKEATEKAEKAKEGKLGVEQELRSWRADQEQRRNACEETQGTVNQKKDFKSVSAGKKEFKKLDQPTNKKGTGSSAEIKTKKNKSLSSKIGMFFSRRKTHPTK